MVYLISVDRLVHTTITCAYRAIQNVAILGVVTLDRAAKMPHERRRELVQAAANEFATAGYEWASLNRIIQICGLSKSSFYHFIDSKKDLFDLVIHDLTADVAEHAIIADPAEFAGDHFWETAHQVFERLVAASAESEAFAALGRMFYLSGGSSDPEGAVSETLSAIQSWLANVLAVGRAAGQVRDDLPIDLQLRVVFAVLRALDEWTVSNLASLSRGEMSQLTDAQFATVKRVLAI